MREFQEQGEGGRYTLHPTPYTRLVVPPLLPEKHGPAGESNPESPPCEGGALPIELPALIRGAGIEPATSGM